MERRLREAKPVPSRDFVAELEQRLLPPPRHLPVVVAGAVAAATLAIVAAVLGMAGVLPLGLGRDEPVQATERCQTVMTETVERRPDLVVGRDGKLRVISRPERVRRPLRSCR